VDDAAAVWVNAGSPHIDRYDASFQYALSVGDFSQPGGELCVELGPQEVAVVRTHDRLACVDGRFPHWVRGYGGGTRYSVIYYVTDKDCATPRGAAVLPPPTFADQETVHAAGGPWVAPSHDS
jgi:hypothetical protein